MFCIFNVLCVVFLINFCFYCLLVVLLVLRRSSSRSFYRSSSRSRSFSFIVFLCFVVCLWCVFWWYCVVVCCMLLFVCDVCLWCVVWVCIVLLMLGMLLLIEILFECVCVSDVDDGCGVRFDDVCDWVMLSCCVCLVCDVFVSVFVLIWMCWWMLVMCWWFGRVVCVWCCVVMWCCVWWWVVVWVVRWCFVCGGVECVSMWCCWVWRSWWCWCLWWNWNEMCVRWRRCGKVLLWCVCEVLLMMWCGCIMCWCVWLNVRNEVLRILAGRVRARFDASMLGWRWLMICCLSLSGGGWLLILLWGSRCMLVYCVSKWEWCGWCARAGWGVECETRKNV